jgi:hypothetical protein
VIYPGLRYHNRAKDYRGSGTVVIEPFFNSIAPKTKRHLCLLFNAPHPVNDSVSTRR